MERPSPSRQARLKRDLESITDLCTTCHFLQVISVSSEALVILFNSPTRRAEYTFTFTEDYPENTIVVCSQTAENVAVISKPLTTAIHEILTENGVPLASVMNNPDLKEEGLMEDAIADPHLNTQVSVVSSEYTEGSEDDFYEDYDSYDPDMVEENVVHPLLERELSLVQSVYGHKALETRIHAGIDEMDVFINIDLNTFLNENTASAWGINVDEPLIILLHIQSISKYLEWLEPNVDVFQSTQEKSESSTTTTYDAASKRTRIGISSQLRKILQTFVSTQWKKINVSAVEREISGTSSHALSSKSVVTSNPVDMKMDAKLAKLIEMGFDVQPSREALQQSQGDVEAACELLANTPPTTSSGGSGFLSSLASFIPGYVRQDSMGAQLKMKEQDDPEEHKKTPGLEKGFLVHVVRYALNRLQSLNEFCVICDEKHVIESGLIKPCVCTRELCVFAFQTLGVMSDAAEAIATDGDVVDLLIAMANSAAHSSRASLILDPYPSLVDPANVNTLALDPQKKNFELLKRVMKEVVASRQSLLVGRSSNLKKDMDQNHPLAFPLMQWIIATCRAHIVLLPQPRQIKSIQTSHQFLLISSPPAKGVAFQQAKQKHGSTFAFHGSNIENWHSIMRKGLLNASGTKLQLHGAAHGSGIYLSPLSTVSFGYTGGYLPSQEMPQPGERDCLAGKTRLKCLALCEVVTSKELKRRGDIWVCTNADNVCTRFFFVYDEITSSSSQAVFDTRQSQCKKEINHAIAHIRSFKKSDQ